MSVLDTKQFLPGTLICQETSENLFSGLDACNRQQICIGVMSALITSNQAEIKTTNMYRLNNLYFAHIYNKGNQFCTLTIILCA